MTTNKLRVLFIFLVLGLNCNNLFAQDQGGDGNFMKESLQDASTVMWCGIGGGILGLSTLSFVDTPKSHLKNVYVGASVGVILGVGIVAYVQANKARSSYGTVGALVPMPVLPVKLIKTEPIKPTPLSLAWTLKF
jgi:hypothetical protein